MLPSRLRPALLLATLCSPLAAQPPVVQITVDAAHPSGLCHPIWNNFGTDEPN